MQTQSVENIFARSWQLLTRNWIIIVPGIIVGVITGVVEDVAAPSATYGDPSTTGGVLSHGLASAAGSLVAGVITVAASIITQCYTVGMSGAAWQRGKATLADGTAALREDAGNVLGTAVVLFALAVAAFFLVVPTFGISMIAYALFLCCMLYAIPSAVVGNHSAFAAIRESFVITRSRIGTTIIVVILLAVIGVLGGIVAVLFAFAPLLGPVFAAVIAQAVGAYSSLVFVGEYLNLRGTPPLPTQVM